MMMMMMMMMMGSEMSSYSGVGVPIVSGIESLLFRFLEGFLLNEPFSKTRLKNPRVPFLLV